MKDMLKVREIHAKSILNKSKLSLFYLKLLQCKFLKQILDRFYYIWYIYNSFRGRSVKWQIAFMKS